MLLVISLVLFLSLVLRGRVWSVWSHQKWNPDSEVPLEMTGLHFDLDFVHNFNHENTFFLDQNRCCQSENKKHIHSGSGLSPSMNHCVCVCHALLLVIKICRIGNNKTFWLSAVTAHSYLISLSWPCPVFCSLVMSATATQCFPGV